MPMDSAQAYYDIHDQYADKAAFLWWLRHIAVEQPNQAIADIVELDRRIQVSLDGLLVKPDVSWRTCESALRFKESGEVFVATIIAFYSQDAAKIANAIAVGVSNNETLQGLISALGWLPAKYAEPFIQQSLTSEDPNTQYLAVAACSVRRQVFAAELDSVLSANDYSLHPQLYGRALRLIGELKLDRHIDALQQGLTATDPYIQFWAIWSMLLLGQQQALPYLKTLLSTAGELQAKAIDLACRALPIEEAHHLINALAKQPQQQRNVIHALAALGDPAAIDWLLDNMQQPELSRLAGEAVTFITGWNLAQQQLTIAMFEGFDAGPNDDPKDPNVAIDPDSNLPWPHADKIAMQWQQHRQQFIAGQRYFLGQPVTSQHLSQITKTGLQRQRHVAALEWALLEPQQILLNTRAKTR